MNVVRVIAPPASQDRVRIVFDCRTVDDPAMMLIDAASIHAYESGNCEVKYKFPALANLKALWERMHERVLIAQLFN